jgi:hypothetical protein
MKKKLISIADACYEEAAAAFEQARTAKKRAETLRVVAAARRAVAIFDEERGDGLRREAALSEREAINHDGMARVYEAEGHRAKSQGATEGSIAERKSVERRTPWQGKAGGGRRRQPAKRRSKA